MKEKNGSSLNSEKMIWGSSNGIMKGWKNKIDIF
jgi:hypothetical protein